MAKPWNSVVPSCVGGKSTRESRSLLIIGEIRLFGEIVHSFHSLVPQLKSTYIMKSSFKLVKWGFHSLLCWWNIWNPCCNPHAWNPAPRGRKRPSFHSLAAASLVFAAGRKLYRRRRRHVVKVWTGAMGFAPNVGNWDCKSHTRSIYIYI